MTLGCFVTGTDTGVGKTLVSCALLHVLRRQYAAVVGMKPVAAGVAEAAGVWSNDDVVALRAASSLAVAPELDNPYLLRDPLSPHLAAQRMGVAIDIALIVERYQRLAALADAVVVEGAGGFCVPLNEAQTGADLARALALPVILVVGLRLGCLNHALLSAQAIRAQRLHLAGWVVSRIDPAMQAADDNVATLMQRLDAPLLADVPHLTAPDAARIRFDLDAAQLSRQLTGTP
jgi:dethiobiotin synthetase